MKIKINTLILLSTLMIFSCSTQAKPVEKDNTSAEAFAELLGFSWWDIELPELSSNVNYGVCYKYADGTIGPAAVMANPTPEVAKKIRVYIRKHHAMRDYFEIYFVQNGTAQPFMVKNQFIGFAPVGTGKTIPLDSPLISDLIRSENIPENYPTNYIPRTLVFKTHIEIN